jgi:hypothetical protein
MYVVYGIIFNFWFCWKYQFNSRNICLILSTIYSFICTCTTIFLKFYNKCDNKNESGHHSSSCFIYFLSSYFTLTSKGQLLKSYLGHNWHAKMTMSSIFLIRIYSTRTITRRRSQGFASGLSLWIILTILSMCGTKISQGMTPARNHLTSIL